LFDSDVAKIYGVETKRINEAVKNNPDKFPVGYIIELDKTEWEGLKSKFSTSKRGGKVKLPSAFHEKGLYMLATIIKSRQAVQATLDIIETFAQIRQLSRNIQELSHIKNKADQKAVMQRSGELIAGFLDDDLQTSDTETSIELNFTVLKFKHTIKKKINQINVIKNAFEMDSPEEISLRLHDEVYVTQGEIAVGKRKTFSGRDVCEIL
jgi:hypothetical protein